MGEAADAKAGLALDRRRLLTSGAGICLMPSAAAAGSTGARDDSVARAAYDQIAELMFEASPEHATTIGIDSGQRAKLKARLDDRSPANRLKSLGPVADSGALLRKIDRSRLSGLQRAQLQAVEWLEATSRDISAFPYGGVDGFNYPVPYVVSHLTGAYQRIPDFLANKHTIERAEDAEAYIDRLAAFPAAINQETERLRQDAARNVLPPDFVVDQTLSQLERRRADGGATSSLVASVATRAAAQGIGGDWAERARRIVDGPLGEALDGQIAALRQHRPAAAAWAGCSRLPEGDGYYRMALRFQTSLATTPQEVHRIGLEQVEELSAISLPLLAAQGLTQGSVGARFGALGAAPQHLYPNTEDGRKKLMRDVEVMVGAMRSRLPDLFRTPPAGAIEVRRISPAVELGAPLGYAQIPSLDGSRQGMYFINLRDTANWPRWALPTLTYHESVPGHLLQAALLLQVADVSLLHKSVDFATYSEGWAVYSEQLADEFGMYQDDPIGRLGYLRSSLWRAARLVADTGIHWKGWSRQAALEYMLGTVGLAPAAAQSEVDRYCAWPGQACAYKIGQLELVNLRSEARRQLGDRFDLKTFHDLVLLHGPMPPHVLREVVRAWATAET